MSEKPVTHEEWEIANEILHRMFQRAKGQDRQPFSYNQDFVLMSHAAYMALTKRAERGDDLAATVTKMIALASAN